MINSTGDMVPWWMWWRYPTFSVFRLWMQLFNSIMKKIAFHPNWDTSYKYLPGRRTGRRNLSSLTEFKGWDGSSEKQRQLELVGSIWQKRDRAEESFFRLYWGVPSVWEQSSRRLDEVTEWSIQEHNQKSHDLEAQAKTDVTTVLDPSKQSWKQTSKG